MEALKKIWNDYQKQIIIILVLVALYLLYNKYGYRIQRFFNPASSNTSPIPLTDFRKSQIQEITQKIKADIYNTPLMGHDYTVYESFLSLYDDEMSFGADYYKNYLTSGTSLHSDLSGEYFITGDVNQRVLDKLTALGKN